MPKTKVTVGIPAFNEEKNIGSLLQDLARQSTDKIALVKIIVLSDGSTDRTTDIVRQFRQKKIYLLAKKKRQGLANAQNVILKHVDSDVLVLLQADIRIKDRFFLERLAWSITGQKTDLVSVGIVPLSPRGFLEKSLADSMAAKNRIFQSLNNGQNLFACYGPARAFSRKLYRKIFFPESVGEDAFSYLYCQNYNFKFMFNNQTEVYFQLPDCWQDYLSQSLRFYSAQRLMAKYFSRDLVMQNYHLPLSLLINYFIYLFRKSLISLIINFFLLAVSRIKTVGCEENFSVWKVAESSKILTQFND